MNSKAAYDLILKESTDGIAYSSRMGDYSTRENFFRMIEAINVLAQDIQGEQVVDRKLFAALFVIGNQVEGNMHGAVAKGYKLPEWLCD